jgi:two-component system, cell cycle sensor histidine kinase and response regulator CckA
VLINLAINARDAMPGGGHFTLRTSATRPGSATLIIEDTGSGMTESTREHLFEPFFSRTGRLGTGLGMTIVHSIITKWGGTIRVDSGLGVGTRFRIELPLAEDEEPEAAPKKPEAPQPEIHLNGGILLVEDNEAVRKLLRNQFRKAGYEVLDAASGEEALRLLALGKHRIDLLITDVMMPKMTGPELAKRVVAQCPETRVLFISGFAEDALSNNELLRKGRAEFVAKPVSPRDLIAKARSLLGSERKR